MLGRSEWREWERAAKTENDSIKSTIYSVIRIRLTKFFNKISFWYRMRSPSFVCVAQQLADGRVLIYDVFQLQCSASAVPAICKSQPPTMKTEKNLGEKLSNAFVPQNISFYFCCCGGCCCCRCQIENLNNFNLSLHTQSLLQQKVYMAPNKT